MTDARYPERWLSDRRILRLSDTDHRTFVTALVWSVSNRTDGVIEHDDLLLMVGATQGSAAALVAAGLWAEEENRWTITDFDSTQTSAHQLQALDNVRRYDRERKASKRNGRPSPEPDVVDPGPAIREDFRTENIGKDSASDRRGQEELREPTSSEKGVTYDHDALAPFRRPIAS